MRGYSHLTLYKRRRIEKLLREGIKPYKIASILGVNNSTIYRELKRGEYFKVNTQLKEVKSYSPELAEDRYRNNLSAKGVSIKLGNNYELAKFIEKKIGEEHYSPVATLKLIEKEGLFKDTRFCTTTLYNYIKKGVFYNLTMQKLPQPRRHRKRRVVSRQWKEVKGTTIEDRDKKILTREEFGHWEMDSVIGKKTSKCSLLVLTERKTRMELIFKLSRKKAENVVGVLDFIEKTYPYQFQQVFKTITVDNGTEFSYFEEMERSCIHNRGRTKIYYCHPFTSCERGSNEVANRMIRRWIPKGIEFDDYSPLEIAKIQDWMNSYPRKVLSYSNALTEFNKELEAI